MKASAQGGWPPALLTTNPNGPSRKITKRGENVCRNALPAGCAGLYPPYRSPEAQRTRPDHFLQCFIRLFLFLLKAAGCPVAAAGIGRWEGVGRLAEAVSRGRWAWSGLSPRRNIW